MLHKYKIIIQRLLRYPYTKDEAFFPRIFKENKFNIPVSRVDDVVEIWF